MAAKSKISGTENSALLKVSSKGLCAPHDFALLLALGGTHVHLILYLAVHQMK